MSGFIMSFVNPLIEKLIDPLLNHLSYTICVDRHVKALEDKVNELNRKKKDTEDEIRIAERGGKEATNEVQGWLEIAEKLEGEANSITNKYSNRNCMFRGTCSFNCFSNHSIGVDAVEMKVTVEEKLRRRDGFREITKEVPPPVAQPVPATTLPEVSRSEIESKLGEALDFLQNEGKSSLGIWGMGGVGKTTLLTHINNALAEGLSFGFDRVVLITASREWTIEKIQKLVSKELNLREEGNHRINIFNHLRNKSFVILLDDLWRRMDLEEVGIPPLGTVGERKCKLILTTRNEQVCRDMEVRQTIKVDCLSRVAARLLFREKVGEEVINSHPLIPRLADEVADECKGLPVALICIARAMSGKRQVNLWEKAIEDLKRSKLSIVPGMEDPLPLLKFSYDYLKNPRIQECLLHCALWPEDYKIPKVEIIYCWMGHGLLGEFDSIDEANNKGDEIIDVLEKASLLEWIEEDDDISGEGYVRLHDLIRDMALWIARDCGDNEKKWVVADKAPQDENSWREAHKMSIAEKGITTLPTNMQGGSNLITLMLQGYRLSHMVRGIFQQSHSLNYLDLSDNVSYLNWISKLRSNMQGSCHRLSHPKLGIFQQFHALKYLNLSDNKRIENFPIEICQLFKLEYLDLSRTRIKGLPEELQNLKKLKYLLLQGNYITEVSSQLLSSLVSLEVLDLSNNWFPIIQSCIINKLECLKGGRLKALGIDTCSEWDLSKIVHLSTTIPIRTLSISLQRTEDLGASLNILPHGDWSRLDRLTVNGGENKCIEELVIEGNHLLFLKHLLIESFNGIKEITWRRVEHRNVISSSLRDVGIQFCFKLKHVSWVVNLPLLERLDLECCCELKQVVFWDEEEATEERRSTFPSLKVLRLSHLNELETIFNHAVTFPSLACLQVIACPKLKKLPFDSPTSCSKLRKIRCEKEWWKNLELDDDVKASLQHSVELFEFPKG